MSEAHLLGVACTHGFMGYLAAIASLVARALKLRYRERDVCFCQCIDDFLLKPVSYAHRVATANKSTHGASQLAPTNEIPTHPWGRQVLPF